MAEEIRQHIELRAERMRATGMSPDDARDAALRDFGGLARIAEECRDQRTVAWLDGLKRDARHACRMLHCKAPIRATSRRQPE